MPIKANTVDNHANEHRQRHCQQAGEMILVDERAGCNAVGRARARLEYRSATRADLQQPEQSLHAGKHGHAQQQLGHILGPQPHRREQARERRQQGEPALFGRGGHDGQRVRHPDTPLPDDVGGEAVERRDVFLVARQGAPPRFRQGQQLDERPGEQHHQRNEQRPRQSQRGPGHGEDDEEEADGRQLEQHPCERHDAGVVNGGRQQEDDERIEKQGTRGRRVLTGYLRFRVVNQAR